MRCEFCEKSVVGDKEVVIIAGKGPVHSRCFEHTLLSRRIFQGVSLSSLPLEDLNEFKEMITIELNSRHCTDDVIELFA